MVVAKELECCVLLENRDFVVHRTVSKMENQAGPDLIALHYLNLVSDSDHLYRRQILQSEIRACFPVCGSRDLHSKRTANKHTDHNASRCTCPARFMGFKNRTTADRSAAAGAPSALLKATTADYLVPLLPWPFA